MSETPVAFIIFNRAETTKRVFETIRRARPKRLLLVSDGPREGRAGEAERVAAARQIAESVDWECEVLKNYSETNLGCRRRVSSGISWVFEQVERAIILEDDCLPEPTFFDYCTELLERYKNEERVMQISGDNFQPGRRTEFSYYFSKYPHIWGWATWRRAWKQYDVELKDFQTSAGSRNLKRYFPDKNEHFFWNTFCRRVFKGRIDTWDYQWAYACWKMQGLIILPAVNLISNIGFGEGATHTHGSSPFANMKTQPMEAPLKHPKLVEANAEADRYTFENHYCHGGIMDSIRWRGRWKRRMHSILRRVLPRTRQ